MISLHSFAFSRLKEPKTRKMAVNGLLAHNIWVYICAEYRIPIYTEIHTSFSSCFGLLTVCTTYMEAFLQVFNLSPEIFFHTN